jgi:hypothetical protein
MSSIDSGLLKAAITGHRAAISNKKSPRVRLARMRKVSDHNGNKRIGGCSARSGAILVKGLILKKSSLISLAEARAFSRMGSSLFQLDNFKLSQNEIKCQDQEIN